jgi:hypothetical protein
MDAAVCGVHFFLGEHGLMLNNFLRITDILFRQQYI